MKQYELLVIYKPNADAEEVDKLIAKVTADAETLGGKSESVEKIGRKKLAYEIQKFRDGFFSSMVLSLPEEKVAEFKRQLRLNDSILRTMFIEKSIKAEV
ncbi:MAG: 30S ribosomal protein S6 [Candidatus Gastranaerophilales bacterium]|nr:30S ribosomal protein S6 [Candidatus Gastranaerophilales bacterium]